MKKIYENDSRYFLLRYLTDRWFRGCFKRMKYVGLDNVPKEGAVILAPNHCNALMDAFAVLDMDHRHKVFVARADIFQNPVIRKILTFLKIMPIHRLRDGFRSVLSSDDTVEKCIEVLNNRVPFCILPEGTHRSMHSLLPLGKGLSRIACGAVRTSEEGRHVYIVPIGLEYGDYYRLRSTLLVSFGQAIDVTELLAAHPEMNEPQQLSLIRDVTAAHLREQIVYIPDDDDYEATWELAKLMSGPVPECRLEARKAANKAAVAELQQLRRQQPEKARQLFDKALAWKQARQKARVSIHAAHARNPLAKALWRMLLMLLALPFGLAFTLGSCPALGACEWLASRTDDASFRNSLRFGVIVVLWTFLLLVAAIVLFCTVKWYWALAALVLAVPAPLLAYEWFEQLRRLASSWRYLFNSRLRRQKQQLLDELNEELKQK